MRRRKRFLCYWCENKFPLSEHSWDHMVPKYWGGENVKTNLVPSCTSCNKIRGFISELIFRWTQEPKLKYISRVEYYLDFMLPKDTWIKPYQVDYLRRWLDKAKKEQLKIVNKKWKTWAASVEQRLTLKEVVDDI